MDLYEKFVKLCNDRGKKPSRVANEIGIPKSIISRWKNGGGISDSTAQKIADYFGISLGEFREFPKGRIQAAPESNTLSAEEWQIIMAYRKADDYAKGIVHTVLAPFGLSESSGEKMNQGAENEKI